MKMQEWTCVIIIVVGLASSAWQINRIKDQHHNRAPLFSVITNHIDLNRSANSSTKNVSPQNLDCATRNLVFKAEAIALTLTTASIDTLNFISNAR